MCRKRLNSYSRRRKPDLQDYPNNVFTTVILSQTIHAMSSPGACNNGFNKNWEKSNTFSKFCLLEN